MRSRCLICESIVNNRKTLCFACSKKVHYINDNVCVQCGETLAVEALKCGMCLKQPPSFDRVYAVFNYDVLARHLIQRLKFHEDFSVVPFLRKAMLSMLQQQYQYQNYPELLLPVPLHRTRLFKRGFNQSVEIGKYLTQYLPVVLNNDLLKKKRHTLPQAELTFSERRKNLKSAFTVTRKIQVESVAVLDDVITTGTTANELASLLKRQGVKRVHVWALARTQK